MKQSIFDVLFVRDEDNAAEWWELFFLSKDEARRWAEYELARRRRRKGTWRAEISTGSWNGQKLNVSRGVDIVQLNAEQ